MATRSHEWSAMDYTLSRSEFDMSSEKVREPDQGGDAVRGSSPRQRVDPTEYARAYLEAFGDASGSALMRCPRCGNPTLAWAAVPLRYRLLHPLGRRYGAFRCRVCSADMVMRDPLS